LSALVLVHQGGMRHADGMPGHILPGTSHPAEGRHHLEGMTMSRFNYKVVQAENGRYAIIRKLENGDVAGYDDVARRNDDNRHFAIHCSDDILHAAADSRQYATRDEAEHVLACMQHLSAAKAFDLDVLGRAQHGGRDWIVFSDGRFRHVVDQVHFLDSGHEAREPDDERRSENYTDWCRRGSWATDDVAAIVAGLCGLTHVHSAESGSCSRVDAVDIE
jgi:hypothetical protein